MVSFTSEQMCLLIIIMGLGCFSISEVFNAFDRMDERRMSRSEYLKLGKKRRDRFLHYIKNHEIWKVNNKNDKEV